jgi:hypothetical protein
MVAVGGSSTSSGKWKCIMPKVIFLVLLASVYRSPVSVCDPAMFGETDPKPSTFAKLSDFESYHAFPLSSLSSLGLLQIEA